jgi:hypothetical protein
LGCPVNRHLLATVFPDFTDDLTPSSHCMDALALSEGAVRAMILAHDSGELEREAKVMTTWSPDCGPCAFTGCALQRGAEHIDDVTEAAGDPDVGRGVVLRVDVDFAPG